MGFNSAYKGLVRSEFYVFLSLLVPSGSTLIFVFRKYLSNAV